MSTENINATTPIKRLMEFVEWAIENELCSSYSDFERKSSLAPRYIMNNNSMGKGNIGTEMLGRIVRAFPQLNLVWLCTGDGSMTVTAPAPAPGSFQLERVPLLGMGFCNHFPSSMLAFVVWLGFL